MELTLDPEGSDFVKRDVERLKRVVLGKGMGDLLEPFVSDGVTSEVEVSEARVVHQPLSQGLDPLGEEFIELEVKGFDFLGGLQEFL